MKASAVVLRRSALYSTEFFVDATALVGLSMVAVEGGRQNALLGRLIDEIPRHLMEDEGVVGKIVIEGGDHPVSPGHR